MPASSQDHDVVLRQVVDQRAKVDAIDASRSLAVRTALSDARIRSLGRYLDS